MPSPTISRCLHLLGRRPCMRIYGKSRFETDWRIVDVFASSMNNLHSRWPLAAGACVTWGATAISLGWDFAESLIREQTAEPASKERPVTVAGGRIRDRQRRLAAGGDLFASASEIMAHECGHTWQALRLPFIYLPVVGAVTLFREGPHLWNHFENQASEIGQFGGLVNGSVDRDLLERTRSEIG
jgi:hypothetical protein